MHLCHCLISTSYLAGLCEIFILLHIWQNCVCFGQFMVRLCRASQMCLFSRWFHKVLESCEQQPFLNYTQFDWSLWKHSRTQPDPNVASLCSNTRKSHRLNQWQVTIVEVYWNFRKFLREIFVLFDFPPRNSTICGFSVNFLGRFPCHLAQFRKFPSC